MAENKLDLDKILITQLDKIESVDDNDVLIVHDVDMDVTKKIECKDLVNGLDPLVKQNIISDEDVNTYNILGTRANRTKVDETWFTKDINFNPNKKKLNLPTGYTINIGDMKISEDGINKIIQLDFVSNIHYHTYLSGHNDITTHYTQYLPKGDGTLVCATTDKETGSSIKPIYINANGMAKEIDCTIQTSVPKNALFTDTKNTAGSTNITDKLYIIGSLQQTIDSQTYSHNGVYIGTDDCLYSNNIRVSVDGHEHSAADITSGTLAVARGGTGQTTLNAAANSLINSLTTGSSTPNDADYYISQYVGGGTTTTTYHRRPMSLLYDYIKGKTDSVYVPLTRTINGHALSANTSVTSQDIFNGQKIALDTSDLDTIKIGGVYYQTQSINATPERNYPEQRAGALLVLEMSDTSPIQLYFVYQSSRIWMRGFYNGSWSAWRKVVSSSQDSSLSEGEAEKAQKLATSRKIFGYNFDGTADIELENSVAGSAVEDGMVPKVNTKQTNKIFAETLLREVRAADNSSEIDTLSKIQLSTEEIFNNWTRISWLKGVQNSNNSEQTLSRNSYSYNDNVKCIVCNRNNFSFSAFMSLDEYEPSWGLTLEIPGKTHSSVYDGDDDSIFVVVGYMVDDNGKFHTLSVVRNGNDAEQHYTEFGLYYDVDYGKYFASDTTEDFQWEGHTNLLLSSTSLEKIIFRGNNLKFTIDKTNGKIVANCTKPNDYDTIDGTISYTLPSTKPSNMTQEQYDNIKYMMTNSTKIGLGTESNPSAFRLDPNKGGLSGSVNIISIYNITTGEKITYDLNTDPPTIIKTETDSDILTPGTFIYSSVNNKLFFVKGWQRITELKL